MWQGRAEMEDMFERLRLDPGSRTLGQLIQDLQWVTSRDLVVKQHIFDYNEEDCRAMRVLWLEDTIAALDTHCTTLIWSYRRQELTARPRPSRILINERHPPQHAARRPASFNAHSSGSSERLSSIHL
jgi:hypothetical protein